MLGADPAIMRIPFLPLVFSLWLSGPVWADETVPTVLESGGTIESAEQATDEVQGSSLSEDERKAAQAIRLAQDAMTELEYRHERASTQYEHASAFFWDKPV